MVSTSRTTENAPTIDQETTIWREAGYLLFHHFPPNLVPPANNNLFGPKRCASAHFFGAKRSSTIQHVPFSIDTHTAEDIHTSGAVTLEDLLSNVAVRVVGSGTFYGGNHSVGRDPRLPDPETERGRIRAMDAVPDNVEAIVS